MQKITQCKSCQSSALKPIALQYSFGIDYQIVECTNCRLRFRNVELNAQEIEQLYGRHYFDEQQHDYFFEFAPLKKQIFERRFQSIAGYCPQKGTILDVGSAVGVFLEVARENGWHETGLEVSEFAHQIARQKGLNSINGSFEKLAELNPVFDVVTLWDVVDHAEYPLQLLGLVRQKIKQGGHIWVETTVIDSTMFEVAERIFKGSFKTIKSVFLKGYPVHHSNYYSSQTLTADIERAGFQVVEIMREPFGSQLFSGSHLAKILFSAMEKLSVWQKKEIVCTIVAKAV